MPQMSDGMVMVVELVMTATFHRSHITFVLIAASASLTVASLVSPRAAAVASVSKLAFTGASPAWVGSSAIAMS